MTKPDTISRVMAVVDTSLREFFPSDYHSRCMYAAIGLAALLEEEGVSSQVVGGDFLCAVISKDGKRRNLQGYGPSPTGAPTHFWVRTHGLLLDLGPTYLPARSSFPLAKLPVLRWDLENPLPDYVDYSETQRYAGIRFDDLQLQKRADAFRACCKAKMQSCGESIALQAWELRNRQSLVAAAKNSDFWAKAMLRFLRAGARAEIPRR